MKKLNIGIFKVLSLAVGLAVGLVLIAKISCRAGAHSQDLI